MKKHVGNQRNFRGEKTQHAQTHACHSWKRTEKSWQTGKYMSEKNMTWIGYAVKWRKVV